MNDLSRNPSEAERGALPGNGLIGWYDSADQPTDRPTYDPPHSGPCVVCCKPLDADTVRTVSVMDIGGTRSFFYRLHRACADDLTPEEQGAYDESALTLGRTHA